MLPKQGLDVELTDNYIRNFPNLAHLKGVKLNIMKLDLKKLTSTNYAEYEVYFTDGSYIHHITVNQTGQVNGIDVFKSWVTKVTPAMFDFDDEPQNKSAPPVAAAGSEPKNNDGRTTCYWCGAPTKHVPGAFTTSYDICTNPSCMK
ncbi:MAG: hypothetical protein WC516_05050 [Patescibacteria group bacterium]|jgi:hypothetical protein